MSLQLKAPCWWHSTWHWCEMLHGKEENIVEGFINLSNHCMQNLWCSHRFLPSFFLAFQCGTCISGSSWGLSQSLMLEAIPLFVCHPGVPLVIFCLLLLPGIPMWNFHFLAVAQVIIIRIPTKQFHKYVILHLTWLTTILHFNQACTHQALKEGRSHLLI